MWIYTPEGFVSIVAHRDDPAQLMVRARARRHLEALIARLPAPWNAAEIAELTPADYPVRTTVPRAAIAAYLTDFAMNRLVYDDFKSQLKDPHEKGIATRVWSALHGLEDDPQRRALAAGQGGLFRDDDWPLLDDHDLSATEDCYYCGDATGNNAGRAVQREDGGEVWACTECADEQTAAGNATEIEGGGAGFDLGPDAEGGDGEAGYYPDHEPPPGWWRQV